MISSIASFIFLGVGIDITWNLINNANYTTWIAHQTETDGFLDKSKQFTIIYYGFLLSIFLFLLLARLLPNTTSSIKFKYIGFGKGYMVTLGYVFVWLLVAAFQGWATWFWYKEFKAVPRTTEWRAGYRAVGMTSAVQMGLTMFPISRGNIISEILQVTFDDALSFHRTSAALAIFIGLLHFILYIISSFQNGGFTELNKHNFLMRFFLDGIPPEKRTYPLYMSIIGLMSLALFLWVAINSWSYIRRRWYMWFYFNHFVVVGAVVLGSLHASPVFYSFVPGIILYTVDGFTRLFQGSMKYNIRTITREPNGFLRLEISDFSRTFYPGQWISINIPKISRAQYHPFTIVNAHRHWFYNSEHQPTNDDEVHPLILLIKPSYRNGSWSNKLVDMIDNGIEPKPRFGVVNLKDDHINNLKDSYGNAFGTSNGNGTNKRNGYLHDEYHSTKSTTTITNIPCRIQGPFGNLPTKFFNTNNILILVGGSGISAGIAITKAGLMMQMSSHVNMKMVWSTNESRSEEMSDWISLIESDGVRDGRLKVRLHRTKGYVGNGSGNGNRLDIRNLLVNWKREIYDESGYGRGTVGRGGNGRDMKVSIFTCGPEGFTHEVVIGSRVFKRKCVHVEGFRR
ncbi:ferric/cupric-chelate reductase [Blyttiomyces sp. JEL0837]|nr:ferric/cupric-chelate reductase [Blyttiomyces sp. JEL0837]